ncbi:proton channel OTOP3-like isoform X2 [Betta splendens]|uniref:Proton channel OTOP3-like isoform X2 n=1 Tax=Betta splendens TaxID=158456 RepID=A0A9W2XFH7_BETSP|nr:proton channel OTOP3-like isoform X2 [Betta splendens]
MTGYCEAAQLDSFSATPRSRGSDGPDDQIRPDKQDSIWDPSRKPLVPGLLGMNVFLLGAALVTGQAFNPDGLKKAQPQVFIVVLMLVGLIWMLWYLLWARKQPNISPHKDHHAGGVTVTDIFTVGSFQRLHSQTPADHQVPSVCPCQSTGTFHLHLSLCEFPLSCSSGLMLILSADLLLWLKAVTEDTIHKEIELEKEGNAAINKVTQAHVSHYEGNLTLCSCPASPSCLVFRKGFEVLYPFNIEYYLMAACMVYVMWKNVARRVTAGHHHHHASHKVTLRMIYDGGAVGLVFGTVVLAAGVTIFVLYQIWVNRQELRLTSFLMFYGYHIAVMPLMCLCCSAGILVHMLERRAHQDGHNPSRKLDVVLLVAAAIGQLALSYFSLVAAAAGEANELLENLDLSYSLLTLLQIILQNIFIIEGLHRHPELSAKKNSTLGKILKLKNKAAQEKRTDTELLDGSALASPAVQQEEKKSPTKRAIQEICAFLILCNIMLWIIPAFGVHPQFENGVGKQFFGFTAWFVMVNLGQPLSVFYRMHSVVALMELFITA